MDIAAAVRPVSAAGLEVVAYRPDQKAAWDRVVNDSRNGNFLHLRDYMDYHAERFVDCSALITRNGSAVAVFAANREGDKVISHAGLTYGGLIFLPGVYAAEVLAIFNLLAAHYRAAGAKSILYKAIPHVMHRMPADEDLYALFRMNALLVRRDLGSAIWMDRRPAMTTLRRKCVSRARALQVAVREGDFFAEFHGILTEVLGRHNAAPVHSLSEMQLLKSRFPSRIRLFGGFSSAGQLLAGTLIYDFGCTAHMQYCAQSQAGRETGALDLVLTHLLDAEFSERSWFSFGISNEHEGRVLNEGLVHQKEGFGGRGVAHDFYHWEI